MADRSSRLVWTAFAAILGFLLAVTLAAGSPDPPRQPVYYPLPHHVPKYPGGVSFRFAMAHDVLHERYPKHGPAHYRERNRLTREKLAKLPADDPATFPLTDDLAAGLTRLGQLDEAVELLRAKLARQEAKGLTGHDLYTTYANLGAILFHARLGEAAAGNAAARKEAEEGIGLIKRAVEVYPEAHFGREAWQVQYAEFVLAAMEKPEVLKQYDFVGNGLDASISPKAVRHEFESVPFSMLARQNPDAIQNPDGITSEDTRHRFREAIPLVGRQHARGEVVKVGPWKSHRTPFDEPCLGIVGMWRQGIGPDPHFALCLGEIMLWVGQRFIAWAAFERASRMADRFGATPEAHQFLRDYCKKRQGQIEATLKPDEVAEVRPKFDAELAYGEGYQKAYQQYEADKIAAGASIFDDHFFDAFEAGREPIASPSGSEEWYATLGGANEMAFANFGRRAAQVGWGLCGAGVAAALMAWATRRRATLAPPGS